MPAPLAVSVDHPLAAGAPRGVDLEVGLLSVLEIRCGRRMADVPTVLQLP
jgi:hypothetical protein